MAQLGELSQRPRERIQCKLLLLATLSSITCSATTFTVLLASRKHTGAAVSSTSGGSQDEHMNMTSISKWDLGMSVTCPMCLHVLIALFAHAPAFSRDSYLTDVLTDPYRGQAAKVYQSS